MPRSLWKGAISFGLVHIPVALYPASREDEVNFDWLDRRTMDPVGYKRINKRTGKEITKENIVKGVEHEPGQYVVLSQQEIADAYPKTTQTIEIEAFVRAQDIPFVYLERPYYLGPIGKGAKVYALLRETLLATQRVGIARVVIQTKQHLAALIPAGPALMLNTLRWPTEIRSWQDLDLPEEGSKSLGIKDRELSMAQELVEDMATDWNPDQYTDHFREAIMALVGEKAQAGEVATVHALEESPVSTSESNVIDLTELLKRSLSRGAEGDKTKTSSTPTAARKTVKPSAAKKASRSRKQA